MQWPGLPIATILIALSSIGCGSTESSSGSSNEASSSSGGTEGTDGCVKTGGMCGCAGSCMTGYHPATPPLLFQCPQPCDQCGACGQECCLPDRDTGGGGGGDAGDASDAGDAG